MEEHVDRAWAATTSATVQAQLAEQPGLTEALRSLECRARRCRVELDEEATKPIAAALPALALQLGAVLPNAEFDRLDEGAGKTRHVIYFAR
ncbi:MAG TPA: hypothetical protein VI299_17135 [Polyangiales bacterium]